MTQVIFYNDSGFPYAVLAAAIRAGKLPCQRLPQRDELEQVLKYCGMGKGNATIFSLGRPDSDNDEEKCLALWSNGNGDVVKRAIHSFLGLFNIKDYRLVQVNTSRNLLITIGVGLSAISLLRPLGMALIYHHVIANYHQLSEAALSG